MNKNINRLMACLLVAVFATFMGCKKEETITIPEEQISFLGETGATYTVAAPNTSFKVQVGTTNVATVDRTFTISVSSNTGAASPAQYTLNKTTITIPAGKATDSIEVRGNFDAYQSGRKDTLIFNITQAGKEPGFNSTYKLALRGPCFEGDVDLNLLLGTYSKTVETIGTGAPYGPYTTTISKVQQLSPTTGTITVTNIFDDGLSPVTFTLDWTNPAARRVTLVTQNAGGNAGNAFGGAYDGIPYGIRPVPGGTTVGTFSICTQTLILRMQIGIFGVGYSSSLYTVNMAR